MPPKDPPAHKKQKMKQEWNDRVKDWWKDWEKCILLPEAERRKATEEGQTSDPHWDPSVKKEGSVPRA